MARPTSTVFLEYVRKSGLIENAAFENSLDEFRRDHGDISSASSETLAAHLTHSNLITIWHADKLLDGKYKGFFLGKYKLLRHLATGSTSAVYLAEHQLTKELRAIKILPRSRVCSTSYVQLFHREAMTAAALDHPNLIRVYDSDNNADQHFFVMDFIDGEDLQTAVSQRGPLSLEHGCNYIMQAAEGLDYAHRNGLVHCDVKPANLMVDRRGLLRVLDLGLALRKVAWPDSLAATRQKEILNTADYLSPEQLTDRKDLDHRADIYNLGCTFYYLVTGRPPFAGGSLVQRMKQHLELMPSDVRRYRPDCPADLAAICRKMLQKDPGLRYQSMRQLIEELKSWFASQQYPDDLERIDPAIAMTIRLKAQSTERHSFAAHDEVHIPIQKHQFFRSRWLTAAMILLLLALVLFSIWLVLDAWNRQ